MLDYKAPPCHQGPWCAKAQRHPSNFPSPSSQCPGGPGRPSTIANILGIFQAPCVRQLSVDCDSCLQRSKLRTPPPAPRPLPSTSSHASGSGAPCRALCHPRLRLQTVPLCSADRYHPRGSGLRVGVGVLLGFSSQGEISGLMITMPTDQRRGEVLSCCRVCCDSEHGSGA